MTIKNKDRVTQLASIIDEKVLPLITSDYVLWGLPYYVNPGDTFIWNGALEMLKRCQYKCLGTCGWSDYKYVSLKKDTVILIIGGGFFGDVWRTAWEYVMNTITLYPDNPIVILPQSIYYESQSIAALDADRLSKLNHLTICVRDQKSYDYGISLFSNPIILVPDLAFHMNMDKLESYMKRETNKILYLKRQDKELVSQESPILDEKVDILDWPAMSKGVKSSFLTRCTYKFISVMRRLLPEKINKKVYVWIMQHILRNLITKEAVGFLSQYKTIYATRLHVMIMSFLIGKKVFIIDNNYGKLSGCYKKWLKDCDNIKIYE